MYEFTLNLHNYITLIIRMGTTKSFCQVRHYNNDDDQDQESSMVMLPGNVDKL